jgi:uncharacterized membrane protein SirB2
MTLYLALKHIHITCVVLSALGFIGRGVLMLRQSPWLTHRLTRTLPHLNDTLLFAVALVMTIMSSQYPFVEDWLTAKLLGLLLYIVLGAYALKLGHTRRQRTFYWLLALLTYAYIVSVALSRDPRGLLMHLSAI